MLDTHEYIRDNLKYAYTPRSNWKAKYENMCLQCLNCRHNFGLYKQYVNCGLFNEKKGQMVLSRIDINTTETCKNFKEKN